ncbi:hypothetical protein MEBOL_000841 [Melittangium boletus DSM 14713]|uniref:Bacteriophage T5 Orf172 DNA-binding domain-containing protein n=2 Tax=Melittangium boletus TaxID=83453 RepID=A0A250I8A7_9BACT|nr:hypothetical protein MEBOL_000841 [Melittangium boletus DSM 14713]
MRAEQHARDITMKAERGAATLRARIQEEQQQAHAVVQEQHTRAEQRARDLIAEAERSAAALRARIQEEQQRTSADLQEQQARAERDLQENRKRADALIAAVTEESFRAKDAANQRIVELTTEAQVLQQNSEKLKNTIAALKNVIEGYGDRYVIPTYGLLDELAEDFGHEEAGQQLKLSRDQMRQKIKSGTAAACDYVEEHRKQTAIDFVLDAFNGKADSILASVKKDNHGTLSQKLRDAFALVNHNGQAFRNARITPEYLQTRIDELLWASRAHELKELEREEQRVLRERIREEEKAQREYERAQKDAQKEEELLRKAMEKAQREIDRASDAQKARFEEQLRDLQEKLTSAEEKNKRALSMAQQTKVGHVYIISNLGSFGEDIYKIGLTRRLEPLDRIRELGDASVPFEFDVHALISSQDAPALERELHKRFVRMQVNKVNPRKEFFRLSLHDIRQEIERMGISARWTLAAECREYKETLAIERAMQDKTFREEEWMQKQLAEQPIEQEKLAG